MNKKITFFSNFIGLFIICSLFTVTSNAQTVIFSEDFASASVGDNTTTTGSGTAWNGNENFIVDPVNSKAFQAGGAVRLGTSSVIGFITSAPIDLSQGAGNFTVSFDVKGWSSEGQIKVIVTGQAEQLVSYTNAITGTTVGPFESKTLTFTGGVSNATIRFETTSDDKRAFIDNVVVTTAAPTVAAPVATAATNIDTNSFTANWEAVTGAESYRLDVSTDDDFTTFVEGYNNLTVNGTSHEVTGLQSNTVYYYRVRAVQGGDTSANSNVISLDTDCGPFTFPSTTSGDFCAASTVADLPFYGAPGYEWYANITDTAPVAGNTSLTDGSTYYLRQTVNNCESNSVSFITYIVDATPPVFEDNEIEVCNSGTIGDVTPEGSGFLFYNTAAETTPLSSTTALVNGATYFVSRVVGACESTRTEVLVSVEVPVTPTGQQEQDFTTGETLADLEVTAEDMLKWFQDAEMTIELPASTTLVDNTTYYAANNDEGCLSEALPVTVNEVLSASAFGLEGLVAYPNPVSNVFTVSYTEPVNTVTVYNMLGQAIVSNNSNATTAQVNMSAVSAGTYLVKVVSGSQTATFKVVKQ